MTYGINPPEQQQQNYAANPPPQNQKKPVHKRWWFWPVLVIAALFAYMLNFDPPGEAVPTTHPPAATESTSAPEVASDVPREWESALNRAERLASRDYSKEGTYRTLMSAYDFPADAAQYAVDSVEADWKANALNKAQDLQNRDYSHKQIGRILSSAYDFTEEEADYALANLEP